MESGLGWKGPYRASRSNPLAMGRDPFHQPRVLRAPSNLALNPAREGATSLGNLRVNNLEDTTHRWKKMVDLNQTLYVVKAISCFCSTCRKFSCFIAALDGAEVPFLGTCPGAGPGEGVGAGTHAPPSPRLPPSASPAGQGAGRQRHGVPPARQETPSRIHRWWRKPTPGLCRDFNP